MQQLETSFWEKEFFQQQFRSSFEIGWYLALESGSSKPKKNLITGYSSPNLPVLIRIPDVEAENQYWIQYPQILHLKK